VVRDFQSALRSLRRAPPFFILAVARRTAELGIRMVLGAQPGGIIAMILGEVGILVAVGGAAGIVGAIVAGRAIESQLFGMRGVDPVVLVAGSAVLAIVAVSAACVPAQQIQPAERSRHPLWNHPPAEQRRSPRGQQHSAGVRRAYSGSMHCGTNRISPRYHRSHHVRFHTTEISAGSRCRRGALHIGSAGSGTVNNRGRRGR